MDEERLENRRAHIRFKPPTPYYGILTLWQARGREIRSRAQRVLLRDIGLGGCSFATNLRLPVGDEEAEWMIELQLGHYTAKPRIVLLHARQEDGLLVYGGRWIMTGLEAQAFRYRFNEHIRTMLLQSPHIHTLYKRVSERQADETFKRLDVSS